VSILEVGKYLMSLKVGNFDIYVNFGKCGSIFVIFSLLNSDMTVDEM